MYTFFEHSFPCPRLTLLDAHLAYVIFSFFSFDNPTVSHTIRGLWTCPLTLTHKKTIKNCLYNKQEDTNIYKSKEISSRIKRHATSPGVQDELPVSSERSLLG